MVLHPHDGAIMAPTSSKMKEHEEKEEARGEEGDGIGV